MIVNNTAATTTTIWRNNYYYYYYGLYVCRLHVSGLCAERCNDYNNNYDNRTPTTTAGGQNVIVSQATYSGSSCHTERCRRNTDRCLCRADSFKLSLWNQHRISTHTSATQVNSRSSVHGSNSCTLWGIKNTKFFYRNLKKGYPILIIFGTHIHYTTCHQTAVQFPTSFNNCFCTTWRTQNKQNITFLFNAISLFD